MLDYCQSSFTIFCSFYLFKFHGQTIELNLVGAVAPLVLSSLFLLYSIHRGRDPLAVVEYSLLVAVLYTSVWTVSDMFTHQISTPGFLFLVVAAVSLALWLRSHFKEISRASVNVDCLQIYSVGTFGVFGSDIIRTGSSFLNIPYVGLDVTPVIIGGNGPLDAIFQSGLYFVLMFIMGLTLLSRIKRRKRLSIDNGETPKIPATWTENDGHDELQQ
jgi:uncharacterized membrane protein